MPRTLDGLTVGDFDEITVNDDHMSYISNHNTYNIFNFIYPKEYIKVI